MNQNKLTFDTENLGVDWVGFNIEGSTDLEPIANYLFESLGFNSTIAKIINGKWKSESLNYDKLNKFQVSFRQYDYNPEFKSYWVGTKVLNILTTLQTLEPIIQNFDDRSFQSSLIVPAFNIKKKKNKWIVSVALAKELYLYSYPFQFSTYFTTYKYNYQFQVKLQIIQATSVQSLKKQFYVQDFLSQFNVSHAKQTQIKKAIIQTLDELKNNRVIQTQIEIHKTDNSLIKTYSLAYQN